MPKTIARICSATSVEKVCGLRHHHANCSACVITAPAVEPFDADWKRTYAPCTSPCYELDSCVANTCIYEWVPPGMAIRIAHPPTHRLLLVIVLRANLISTTTAWLFLQYKKRKHS
jgi:hypothetical protein